MTRNTTMMSLSMTCLLGACSRDGGEAAIRPPDVETSAASLFDLEHESEVTRVSWISGETKKIIDEFVGIDCVEQEGDNRLVAGLSVHKEPSGNLDNFIGRMFEDCREYDSTATAPYEQVAGPVPTWEVFHSNFRPQREGPETIPVDEVPIGVQLTVNANKHLKDIQLIHAPLTSDAIDLAAAATTNPLTGYGGTVEVRTCPEQEVVTGIEVRYSENNGKVRELRILCRPLRHAADAIDDVIGEPMSDGWSMCCGAGASAPSSPSQLVDCAGMPNAPCLERVTIPSDEFPSAVCNDGTPAIFYVREGSQTDRDKWVIHLQGGGRCTNWATCLDRWCGKQGTFDATTMSTDWDADGVIDPYERATIPGITAATTGNDYAMWTHAWVYYCSSDSWMGQVDIAEYIDPDLTDGDKSFSLHNRGHSILEAVKVMLKKDNRNPVWSSDAGTESVPDIDDADEILFTGTSAGAKGALMNADWFLGDLAASTKRILIDGNLDPSDTVADDEDINFDAACDGITDQSFSVWRTQDTNNNWAGGWLRAIGAFADESCQATYEPLGRMDLCFNMSPLLGLTTDISMPGEAENLVPEIEHPVFLRVDLHDPVLRSPFHEIWANGECLREGVDGTRTTRDHFTLLTHATMKELADDPDNNVTGIFGPRCAQHVGLEHDAAFRQHETPDTTPNPWSATTSWDSFHDSLGLWRSMGTLSRMDTADVGDPFVPGDAATTFSTCN